MDTDRCECCWRPFDGVETKYWIGGDPLCYDCYWDYIEALEPDDDWDGDE